MSTRNALCFAMAAVLAGLPTGALAATCADMAGPFAAPKPGPKRPITQRDIIELRDIGSSTSPMYGLRSRLAVSPNGRQVAFGMIRADVDSNSYCQAVYVLDLKPGSVARQVSAGGEPQLDPQPIRGLWVKGGSITPIIPVWSPDGRSLAFLRADRGLTQAWRVQRDGSNARPITAIRSNVTALAWSRDGGSLLYATSQSAAEEDAAIDREALTGWHYDARVHASYGLRPLVGSEQSFKIAAVTLATGVTRPATAAEIARVGRPMPWQEQAPATALAEDGRRAWGEHEGGARHTPISLYTSDANGRRQDCNQQWCRSGIYQLWWDPDGPGLYVQRREGPAKEVAAFYHWVPGQSTARRFFATTDIVNDCAWAAAGLVCTRENATMPRHLVLIDRRTGQSTRIFDPNPAFANIDLGLVRRFHVKNALGLESWGDLVLPSNYRPGQTLPLVLVQYKSQGFLRAGVGDEYPIYPMVQRGFAVLSVERPPFFSSMSTANKTGDDSNSTNFRDWKDRRNVLSSIELLLDQVIATGAIDAKKIGITGLSDGAATGRFAMINSKRFAAAALSSCCTEPSSALSVNGPAYADVAVNVLGFPPLTRPDPKYWAPFSLLVSGKETSTPLLMHLADREAASAFETFQALREYRKPVDAFIYPDEYHNKWHPRAKLAVSDRTIDWFAFWLQGRVDPDPAKAAQFAHWSQLRERPRSTATAP